MRVFTIMIPLEIKCPETMFSEQCFCAIKMQVSWNEKMNPWEFSASWMTNVKSINESNLKSDLILSHQEKKVTMKMVF